MRAIQTIGLALAMLLAGRPSDALASCADMMSAAGPAAQRQARDITPRDLLEMRDIGDPESSMTGRSPRLAISPDGRRVAFALVRGDLASNGYCQSVFVADLDGGTKPRLVASGGDYRKADEQLRGFYATNGSMLPLIPAWSPDGRTLAYLRSDAGRTQVWIARADGGGSRPLTQAPGDVSAIAWSNAGRLIYAWSPSTVAEQAAIDREGQGGWLYDRRVFTSFSLRPLVAIEQRHEVVSVGLAAGDTTRAATRGEARLIPADFGLGYPTPPVAVAPDGRRAWTEHKAGGADTPLQLITSAGRGRRLTCTATWCQGGIYALWWEPNGAALFVQRREGWRNEITAFYRWVPGETHAQRLFATTDIVQDCGWAVRGFVCTRENSTTPRRIAVLDRRSGQLADLFDPNSGFKDFRLGQVTRLRAKNYLGLESWADLVLPPGYRGGTKLPLVIVQYRSQGFLRGGTGNEYPIYPLAARGFAVLSFERPDFAASASPALKTQFAVNAASLKGWSERKNTLSSLLAELDLAERTGAIDPARIGITGLSDGASTVRFAMLNSKRFAAAALSTCCFDANSVMSASGPAFADYLQQAGLPPTIRPDPAFWAEYSLAVSGAKTETPLLLQLADHEAPSALETFQAMREYRKPIEMIVFPDEYHVKWQPVHKLAAATRAIDWFVFWLLGEEDPNPAKTPQYARWRVMRSARRALSR